MFWFIIGFAIALVAVYALAPKPESQPRPEFGDIKAPVAEAGSEIPVLFGCRDVRGPNVVWYGDFRTIRIRSDGGKK